MARSLFTKTEISTALKQDWWPIRSSTPCPYCGAKPRRHCRTLGTGNVMLNFHKARVEAFLLARMFIISEELDLADIS